MSVITFKCANCGSDVRFDPGEHKHTFACDHCGATYTEEEAVKLQAFGGDDGQRQEQTERHSDEEDHAGETLLYSCPNCGAEIITDATTSATFCVYCHSPVVISSKLAGEFAPSKVVPFAVELEKIHELFSSWCKKKWFIKSDFGSKEQSDKIRGVYYPYWIVGGRANVDMDALAYRMRSWRSGNYEYTETKTYSVQRKGTMDFSDIPYMALNKQHIEMLNGLHPFSFSKAKKFSMPYLSGFLAEKRNLEKEYFGHEMKSFVTKTGNSHLSGELAYYASRGPVNARIDIESENWEYIMLPAWMLTYHYNGKSYYFAVNGETGKIAGKVPVSAKKLAVFFGGLTLLLSVVFSAIGWYVI